MPEVLLSPGTRLGSSLCIVRHVGSGGMGAVYLARDELLDRFVAIKLLHRDAAGLERQALRTLIEARAAARVVHPHVVAVHGVGDFEGAPYIEMEWVEGQSLRAVLRRSPPDRGLAAAWIAQLAAALQHAHDAGVVHCDVKPENVLVRGQQGSSGTVKLADFGLARSHADGNADLALSQATLAYLAPEAGVAAPTERSDQFSLAIVAAELLGLGRPSRASWAEAPVLEDAHDLPAAARVALERALSLDPVARFASTSAFADALLRGLGLAHARAPLVATMVRRADEPATSAELPIPGLGLGLDLDPATCVLAALAVLPPGYPDALTAVLGEPPAPEILAALQRAGRLQRGVDEWRLGDPDQRDVVLAQISNRQARMLCARAAAAIETTGPQRESVREDATRLYMAARRLDDAARLALESAGCARSARQRDHHLARAASLLASPVRPLPWLSALVQRCEWALQCGWSQIARGPIAEAQGVLADARLPGDHPLALRVAIAAAELRVRLGDPRAAVSALRRLREVPVSGEEAWALQVLVAARLVNAQARAGARAQALELGDASVLRFETGAAPRHLDQWQFGLAQLHAATGTVALRCGLQDDAIRHIQRAVAIHQERGDPLQTAATMVALANAHFDRGAVPLAVTLYEQARKQTAHLGDTELAAIIEANLGDCWLRLGKTAQSLRSLQRAQLQFEVLGIDLHKIEVLGSLIDAYTAGGDVANAAECKEERDRLVARRSGQRPA